MMYKKAICFNDKEIADQILATNDVAKIKALGRKVRGYDDSVWDKVRQGIVHDGLLAKFSQNKELKECLLNTGDAILAECSPFDRIWGIGLSIKNPDSLEQVKWRGRNLLGFTLMQVREELKNKVSD